MCIAGIPFPPSPNIFINKPLIKTLKWHTLQIKNICYREAAKQYFFNGLAIRALTPPPLNGHWNIYFQKFKKLPFSLIADNVVLDSVNMALRDGNDILDQVYKKSKYVWIFIMQI